MASFDRIKHPEEGVLREEHRGTVQKTLAAFNASAVRVGSAQKSMKSLFSNFSKRHLSSHSCENCNDWSCSCELEELM
ncbi:uncharacterized protein LOC131241121 isoform X3 [Magnolia sinica]|uniref:uncharacterized protein LOC131241121 isoform X3 n=1 Tax=Magnolia sinica TaxID=86752 RepID=UPI0026580EEB|nr:uncharacterized protein LOC131241121 isoform X3 [Magnolia sinica]